MSRRAEGGVRPLPEAFRAFPWALSTAAAADLANLPRDRILRFDGNTPPAAPPYARPETVAAALAQVHAYPHGGHERIHDAIAAYAGVEPENVVLGAGADDLLLLCGRAFAGPGEVVAVADEPTYPVYRMAAWLAGADVGDAEPVVTFCCRPHNPTGALVELPEARPLVVDEAYFEYAGETAAGLLDDGVVVVRTFSKAFGLAAARIGYALAARELAEELTARQAPLPVSTPAVALALAALEAGTNVAPVVEERERLAARLRSLGLQPPASSACFLYVPVADAHGVADALLRRGLLVRGYPEAIRITIRTPSDDDVLVDALAKVLGAA